MDLVEFPGSLTVVSTEITESLLAQETSLLVPAVLWLLIPSEALQHTRCCPLALAGTLPAALLGPETSWQVPALLHNLPSTPRGPDPASLNKWGSYYSNK